jgi:outer membrane protein OmpA-like peptidoglycan-associated protein
MKHPMHLLAMTLSVIVGFHALTAHADQGLFSYKLTAKGQTDGPKPSMVLRSSAAIVSGTVSLQRNGKKTKRIKLGRMGAGDERTIALDPPKGTHRFEVTIEAKTQSGQSSSMRFETEVSWVDPIRLAVDPDRIDIGTGQLILASNRPLDRVDIEIFGGSERPMLRRTQEVGGSSGDLRIKWSPPGKEITAIRLTAHDVDGFWNAVLLEPFWVEIPHREVIFDFGKPSWQDSETPKLDDTLKEIKNAMTKYARHGLELRLYIAGYTDTVGSPGDNQKLSRARAKSIGKWFRSKGMKIPIFFQGFGERGLAVKTPDNTAEAKNRRAIYILGNAPPPTSSQIPYSRWSAL